MVTAVVPCTKPWISSFSRNMLILALVLICIEVISPFCPVIYHLQNWDKKYQWYPVWLRVVVTDNSDKPGKLSFIKKALVNHLKNKIHSHMTNNICWTFEVPTSLTNWASYSTNFSYQQNNGTCATIMRLFALHFVLKCTAYSRQTIFFIEIIFSRAQPFPTEIQKMICRN